MHKITEQALTNIDLSADEFLRYERHLVLPEIGIEGQKKLKAAKVLLIGAGGLGSPAGMYLAAAGVGKIGIVEYDDVSFSNLQRQILFVTDDVGNSKVMLAKFRLNELNPEIEVLAHDVKLSKENALEIIKDYDIVVDGSDNFATRYLVNDACVMLNKPFVSGSVLKFEGQLSFFDSSDGPCYRCLFPMPPQGNLSCSDAGVLGVLPGIIGSLQANEVIKFIIGKGELLKGRLLKFDSMKTKFSVIHFEKNPDCPVCSDNPLITELQEFNENCNSQNKSNNNMNDNSNWEISVEELKQKIDNNENFLLLDVREYFESDIATLGGTIIPLKELPDRHKEMNVNEEIIVYCRSGNRSHTAVEFLRDRAGFKKMKNLVGGVLAWSDRIDNKMKKY